MEKYEELLQAILDAVENGDDEEFVAIPMSRYTELIRAETERNILESAIKTGSYHVDSVMKAIETARKVEAEAEADGTPENNEDGEDSAQ